MTGDENALCEMGNCNQYAKMFRIKRLKKGYCKRFKFINFGNRKNKHCYIQYIRTATLLLSVRVIQLQQAVEEERG